MSITQNVVIIVYHQAKNQKAQACVSGYAEMLNIMEYGIRDMECSEDTNGCK